MDEVNFRFRFYNGPVFWRWMRKVCDSGGQHGAELVISLGTAEGNRPGMTDNVHAASKWLALAIKEKLVMRADKPSMTRDQRFLGVGGVSYGPNMVKQIEAIGDPVIFFFEPGPMAAIFLKDYAPEHRHIMDVIHADEALSSYRETFYAPMRACAPAELAALQSRYWSVMMTLGFLAC